MTNSNAVNVRYKVIELKRIFKPGSSHEHYHFEGTYFGDLLRNTVEECEKDIEDNGYHSLMYVIQKVYIKGDY